LASSIDQPGTPVGRVFDIQHYAVHDGPGIRTIVFLKGCPLRCPWCCNPESHEARLELRHVADRCLVCGRCVASCPAGAIRIEAGRHAIDRSACPACGAPCAAACPESALERVGSEMTVAEVVARVDADRDFYRNSGGGVTFSGGEPLAQPEFLAAAARACRERGLHTAIETSGCAAEPTFRSIAPLVDLFLFDVKVVDRQRHEALTGADNSLILANLAHLASTRPGDVIVRLPIIPGCTDDQTNLDAVAALMRDLGLMRLELEPYHPFGSGKYEALGRPWRCTADPHAIDGNRMAALVSHFSSAGLTAGVA